MLKFIQFQKRTVLTLTSVMLVSGCFGLDPSDVGFDKAQRDAEIKHRQELKKKADDDRKKRLVTRKEEELVTHIEGEGGGH